MAATRFTCRRRGVRVAALASGYPSKRSELFAYDGIIFGNIEADFFTREQLELTATFVAERGGGLLVLGARSFDRQGLAGTPLEEVLPVDLTDRRGDGRAARRPTPPTAATPNTPALTADGAAHPATRLAVDRRTRAGSVGGSCRRWRRSRRSAARGRARRSWRWR